MRWLVVGLVVLASRPASALRIRDLRPPLARNCPQAPSWNAVTSCIAAHGGTPHVVQTRAGAKLVRLERRVHDEAVDIGLALYVQRGAAWSLAGVYEQATGTYEVLAFDRVTIGRHTGYRIDIGSARPTPISRVVTTIEALWLVRESMYCSGVDWMCTSVVTSCDLLVHGNAQEMFRGALTIADNMLRLRGDRGNAGTMCDVPDRDLVGWRAD